MEFILLIAGLALVIAGASFLTDGASALARRAHISEFIVGVTVVGIGTSIPELVVSLGSALKGSGDMAVGNVVGSNAFNVFVILGITALITPLSLTRDNIRKDIPFGVLAAIALFICVSDRLLGDSSLGSVSRSEGLLLLCLFILFMAYTIYSAPQQAEKKPPVKEKNTYKPVVMAGMIIGGLAALVYGGELFLTNALVISLRYGISESVIAITLLAGGTSLPELASCVASALKKKPQLALGNILGSNISNIFLVLGASATAAPLKVSGVTPVDLFMVVLASVVLFISAFTFKKRQVSRAEGILFLLIYAVYLIYLLTHLR